jgi:hypothetical protein
MQLKKRPETDEERIEILRAIIDREELNNEDNPVLSVIELHELRNFLLNFEGTDFCLKQAREDEDKTNKSLLELFNTAQLYISHFIQVLLLAVIRNEIRTENLSLYGLDENNLTVPDLSSEEAVLDWGERLIKGETERTNRGGGPIYNPPIAKVKVHYDLFKDLLHSLKICRQNTVRNEDGLSERRTKADQLIWDIWTRVENKYWDLPPDEREQKYQEYQIKIQYSKGVQLNVFD